MQRKREGREGKGGEVRGGEGELGRETDDS